MSNEPPENPGPQEPWDAPGAVPSDGDYPDDMVFISPLLAEDPPRIGEFWLDGRLGAVPAGVAFTGHAGSEGSGQEAATAGARGGADVPVMILLLSEGAAADAAARDRFAGLINALHIDTVIARGGQGQDSGRLARKFRPGSVSGDPIAPDDRQAAPWAALAYDGSPAAAAEAERILNEVQLSWLPQQGKVSGPDYRLHWIDRVKPGLARLWPLPWPGRYTRAGWRSILVSWLLMMLLAALAVLIAILIFQNQPPQAPPPPTGGSGTPPPQSGSPPPQSGSPPPQSGSPSPQSGSPSPQSGSPSPQSGSPSPQSGSPSGQSGSPSMSGSASGSPSPSGSADGGEPSSTGTANASETPRSRL
jgi:hypothetical protein